MLEEGVILSAAKNPGESSMATRLRKSLHSGFRRFAQPERHVADNM